MNWETLQDAIKAWFASITGLSVVWENEKRPHLFRDAFGVLSTPTNVVMHGHDYVQEPASADPLEIDPTVVGQRSFEVSCRVVSRNQAPNKTARWYLERARLSLKFPSVLESFRVAQLGVATIGDIVAFDAPWDDRVESVAAFVLRFNTVSTLTDVALGTIGSIELSSTLEDTPTPPNLDDEVISLD